MYFLASEMEKNEKFVSIDHSKVVMGLFLTRSQTQIDYLILAMSVKHTVKWKYLLKKKKQKRCTEWIKHKFNTFLTRFAITLHAIGSLKMTNVSIKNRARTNLIQIELIEKKNYQTWSWYVQFLGLSVK